MPQLEQIERQSLSQRQWKRRRDMRRSLEHSKDTGLYAHFFCEV